MNLLSAWRFRNQWTNMNASWVMFTKDRGNSPERLLLLSLLLNHQTQHKKGSVGDPMIQNHRIIAKRFFCAYGFLHLQVLKSSQIAQGSRYCTREFVVGEIKGVKPEELPNLWRYWPRYVVVLQEPANVVKTWERKIKIWLISSNYHKELTQLRDLSDFLCLGKVCLIDSGLEFLCQKCHKNNSKSPTPLPKRTSFSS